MQVSNETFNIDKHFASDVELSADTNSEHLIATRDPNLHSSCLHVQTISRVDF
jgi:hypothetical protein